MRDSWLACQCNAGLQYISACHQLLSNAFAILYNVCIIRGSGPLSYGVHHTAVTSYVLSRLQRLGP